MKCWLLTCDTAKGAFSNSLCALSLGRCMQRRLPFNQLAAAALTWLVCTKGVASFVISRLMRKYYCTKRGERERASEWVLPPLTLDTFIHQHLRQRIFAARGNCTFRLRVIKPGLSPWGFCPAREFSISSCGNFDDGLLRRLIYAQIWMHGETKTMTSFACENTFLLFPWTFLCR